MIESMYGRCQLFGILLKREGQNFIVKDYTVEEHLHKLYHQAGCLRHWAAVRYTSSLLHHNVDSISPFITAVLVHGKQVCFFILIHSIFIVTCFIWYRLSRFIVSGLRRLIENPKIRKTVLINYVEKCFISETQYVKIFKI